MILYESEIFGEESKNILPFKIIVEQDLKEEYNSIVVKEVQFIKTPKNTILNENLLKAYAWKEKQ